MKATDLMIGDWVLYENEPSVISLLDDQGFALIIPGVNAEVIVERDLRPIPLTPEILEKNGFELYGNEWQYHTEDDKCHILIEFSKNNKLSINIYNVLALKDDKGRSDLVHFVRDWCDSFYVHQFQHALRLCGIEKEIVL